MQRKSRKNKSGIIQLKSNLQRKKYQSFMHAHQNNRDLLFEIYVSQYICKLCERIAEDVEFQKSANQKANKFFKQQIDLCFPMIEEDPSFLELPTQTEDTEPQYLPKVLLQNREQIKTRKVLMPPCIQQLQLKVNLPSNNQYKSTNSPSSKEILNKLKRMHQNILKQNNSNIVSILDEGENETQSQKRLSKFETDYRALNSQNQKKKQVKTEDHKMDKDQENIFGYDGKFLKIRKTEASPAQAKNRRQVIKTSIFDKSKSKMFEQENIVLQRTLRASQPYQSISSNKKKMLTSEEIQSMVSARFKKTNHRVQIRESKSFYNSESVSNVKLPRLYQN